MLYYVLYSLSEPLSADKSVLITLADEAPLPEKPSPKLDTNYAKDEEDEEAEEEDIAQHGEGVQQEHHQDPHTLHYMLALHIALISDINHRYDCYHRYQSQI